MYSKSKVIFIIMVNPLAMTISGNIFSPEEYLTKLYMVTENCRIQLQILHLIRNRLLKFFWNEFPPESNINRNYLSINTKWNKLTKCKFEFCIGGSEHDLNIFIVPNLLLYFLWISQDTWHLFSRLVRALV